MEDIYHVWKRNDGYVGASNGRKPEDGPTFTFSHLLTTSDWSEEEALILIERKKSPHWLHRLKK